MLVAPPNKIRCRRNHSEVAMRKVFVKYRPTVNTGGRPKFGGVEMTVGESHAFSVVVDLPEDQKWLPAIRVGLDEWSSLPLEVIVKKVYSHPKDTTERYLAAVVGWAMRDAVGKIGHANEQNALDQEFRQGEQDGVQEGGIPR